MREVSRLPIKSASSQALFLSDHSVRWDAGGPLLRSLDSQPDFSFSDEVSKPNEKLLSPSPHGLSEDVGMEKAQPPELPLPHRWREPYMESRSLMVLVS